MTRWRISPAVAAALAGAGGFIYVYLAGGAIENDHFVMLARAHQVLFGDWPVRDFEDPGMPLAYLVSSVAAAVFGPSLLVNVILSLALFGVAVALTYLLAFRASGSALVAAVAVAITIAIYPRLYNTTKVLVPIVAMALAWAYVDEPDRKRLTGLAAWSAVAFLLRHDYLVYVAVSYVTLLLAAHGDLREAGRRAGLYIALTMAFTIPWLVYVQWGEGLVEYFGTAVRFVQDEGQRTAGGAPSPLFYVCVAVPVAALATCWRQGRSAVTAQLASAAVLLLSMDVVFLRDVLAARLPDVIAPTTVVAAALAGRTLTRRVVGACGVAVLAVVLLWAVLPRARRGGSVPAPSALVERALRVGTRLQRAAAEIQPQPALAPLADYLARCTAAADHVLVGGFGPEIPVLAHRPFAAGLPAWIPGYYEDPRDVARAVARLNHEAVGAVVMLNGAETFARSWPDIDRWIHAHDFEGHAVAAIDPRVRVWLPRARAADGADPATGLPCQPR
jgi:hypothetical protein